MKRTDMFKRMLTLLLAMSCLMAVLVVMPLDAAAKSETDSATVQEHEGLACMNVLTGEYLNVDYGVMKNKTPVRVWPWDHSKEQLFNIVQVGPDTYRILSNISPKYAIDIYRGTAKLKVGQLCNLWLAGDDPTAQNLLFYACGDGSYILRMASNPNLALAATSSKGQVKLVKFDKNSDAQKWVFKNADGEPVDITKPAKDQSDKVTIPNPLVLGTDYITASTFTIDGKEYGFANTLDSGAADAYMEFFVDQTTQNIVVSPELIQKLLAVQAYYKSDLTMYQDIEAAINSTCQYIDEYTNIRGCDMIGGLIGKGATALTHSAAALLNPEQCDNAAKSFGKLFMEAAALDERVDIQMVLLFANQSIQYGLSALSVIAENHTPGACKDTVALRAIEDYAKCKGYFAIVEGLTKEPIEDYKSKPWYQKLLDGLKDATESLADGVTGDLFDSMKKVEKVRILLKTVKLAGNMIEADETCDKILKQLKNGNTLLRGSEAAYKTAKAPYLHENAAPAPYVESAAVIAQLSTKNWDALVGKTIASIRKDGVYTKWYNAKNNISAKGGYTGQCTWYALGRFNEVTGINLGKAPNAKKWLSANKNNRKVEILYGADKIVAQSIAVDTSGTYGHVLFVEHVTYKNGKPQYVFFTECNWDGNGVYNPSKDCILKKMTYKQFLAKRSPDGYIVAK